MAVVSLSEACVKLGYKSRSTLSRLRAEGKLASFDRPGGKIELDGLPEYLAQIMRSDARPVLAADGATIPKRKGRA